MFDHLGPLWSVTDEEKKIESRYEDGGGSGCTRAV
jgi:hypothetical protein